ncbi:MAG: hypothetical protein AUJ52_04375 [Elusimicrobia bacterium CG1_02_63_36]|nr:MAG: hypothetical protein AUJ52_04375 [Elusimicrobia bacterium CG1_02_63_36]PIP82270.1 MAG: SAM-dependent methyltransferase [Elusimicrobia bacterium CG22_combo_CG10-13_8_21_14_all_63_91]PJA15312.1 MAG: SAM-dependent methyltransferase [Elusimicrobia bacterium CG_4_10_14_0_2_um_filter_63_34]PJB27003.1 MAG: SAM-dependent methyltransferase [Elusimicrobia bacterium CG_4_9_14_3_um_filter_62_55]
MNDRQLLKFYLDRGSPEAQRWNLSPESLSAELASRSLLMKWLKPRKEMRACNVGIGVGEWDDFLGYWLEGRGTLTSIDRDRKVAGVFAYRQRRELHPNPAKVLCRDVVSAPAPARGFDLISVLGSTSMESNEAPAFWSACHRLLRKGGRLFCLGFRRQQSPQRLRSLLQGLDFRVEKASVLSEKSYFVFLAKKGRTAKR